MRPTLLTKVGVFSLAAWLLTAQFAAATCFRHRARVAGCFACGAGAHGRSYGYGPGYAAETAACAPAMVPQTEVTWQDVTETVYDQVPVTQTRTEYRTEYKTEQVPVTRTVVDQVP